MALDTRIRPAQTPELDGVDRILVATLVEVLSEVPAPQTIAVINPVSAALLKQIQLIAPQSAVFVHNDQLDQKTLIDGVPDTVWVRKETGLDSGLIYAPELLVPADLVLVRLPKSLDALADLAAAAAAHLKPEAFVIAAARQKYLTPSQTQVLAASFENVHATLGQFKSRALIARRPRPGITPPPVTTAHLSSFDLTLGAFGGVFAGAKLDLGTRFLLETMPQLLRDYQEAQDFVDLGCGTGVLSVFLAKQRPDAQVQASDLSRIAVQSTLVTVELNEVTDQVQVTQDNALSGLSTGCADVVVCNPPFHAGTALETRTAERMFEQAARVLRPNGEMWTVFNTPLKYTPILHRTVGPTEVIAQNNKFQITRSTTPAR